MGRFRALACPCPPGPRHSGHSAATALNTPNTAVTNTVITWGFDIGKIVLSLSEDSISRVVSSQNFFHRITANIRQSVISPLETVRKLGVLNPEQVQNGRLKIVRMNRILRHVIPKFIR